MQVERINVYTDVSSQQGHRYMVIGGLWVPVRSEPALRQSISAWRSRYAMAREFKWTKVSVHKLTAYQAVVDVLYGHPHADFRCLVVDTTTLNHRIFAAESRQAAFDRLYSLLLRRALAPACVYSIYPDAGTGDLARFDAIRTTCNLWWRRSRRTWADPVRVVERRDSKTEDLLQLADVLLGAVAARCNGVVTSEAKLVLLEHIETKRNGLTLCSACSPLVPKLNVWRWTGSRRSPGR